MRARNRKLVRTKSVLDAIIFVLGLAGRDAWEEAKVDELADYWKDVMIEIAPYIRTVVGVDPGEKAGIA